jgi:predicted RNase H-like HicB family nuclease
MARPDGGYLLLTFSFEKQADGRWTAYCEELGTATFASTLDEAKDELLQLVQLHVRTLEEVNERDRFFNEHNIKVHPSNKRLVKWGTTIDASHLESARMYEPYKLTLATA